MKDLRLSVELNNEFRGRGEEKEAVEVVKRAPRKKSYFEKIKDELEMSQPVNE